jgi:murein DD-endopeptidase MepM/ murein hydrolase activator NlpD
LRFNWPVYTVQQGDTLFELALESGVRVDILREANCLTLEDEISVGQSLRVPPDTVLADYAPPEGCQRSTIRITAPRPGHRVSDILRVSGIVTHARLGDYQLQLRRAGMDKADYEMIFESDEEVHQTAELAVIPLSDEFDPGLYWLRLEAFTPAGQTLSSCAVRIRIESSQN